MTTNRHLFSNFLAGCLLLLAILAWIIFAPGKLGGQDEYILINGNSMEPRIKTNDLIIVRKSNSYQIGDAVAYHNPILKVIVFHRIVGLELDHYFFKGDNNSWVDSYHPTLSELVGKQWIFIPNIGKLILWIRAPLNATLFVTIIGGLTLGFLLFKPKKKNKSGGSPKLSGLKGNVMKKWRVKSKTSDMTRLLAETGNPHAQPPSDNKSKQWIKAKEFNGLIEISFFVFGFLAIVSIVLGLFAFFNPLTRQDTQENPYQQKGEYSYAATAPLGVYDTQMINSGDPVFTKLTCKINLLFHYIIEGTGLQNISGSHQLTAILSDPASGWTRVIPLESQQLFTQNSFSSQVQLDLCQMQSIIKTMEIQTEMTPYTYSLAINPLVLISGQLNGTLVTDTFVTPLVFQMDAFHISMVKADPQIDPLNPIKEGISTKTFIGPNYLTLLTLKIPVALARTLSIIGIIFSLIGLLFLLIIISRTNGQSKEMLVRMKFGSSMVDVKTSENNSTKSAVDVVDIDDLVRLAERNNTVVLHEVKGWLHTYLVEADQVTYRFILNAALENPDLLIRQNSHISAFNLQQGIDNAEFRIYYQPIVSILDKKILAVEALLRWERPHNGMVAAKDFILQAETTGLIDILGEWVLQEASKQVKEWRKNGLPLRLVVNFSRRQIEMNPAHLISHVLEQTGMDLDDLQIEISETCLLKDPDLIYSNLTELQKMGVHLSVDGYTGISSLTNLKQIPFESIKIDGSLIKQLDQPLGAEYVQAIISAVLDRGLNVVAEGVENHFQMNMLRSQYCSQAQGYLIAHPSPAAEMTIMLSRK